MRRRGKEIKNDESDGMSTTPIGPAWRQVQACEGYLDTLGTDTQSKNSKAVEQVAQLLDNCLNLGERFTNRFIGYAYIPQLLGVPFTSRSF